MIGCKLLVIIFTIKPILHSMNSMEFCVIITFRRKQSPIYFRMKRTNTLDLAKPPRRWSNGNMSIFTIRQKSLIYEQHLTIHLVAYLKRSFITQGTSFIKTCSRTSKHNTISHLSFFFCLRTQNF